MLSSRRYLSNPRLPFLLMSAVNVNEQKVAADKASGVVKEVLKSLRPLAKIILDLVLLQHHMT